MMLDESLSGAVNFFQVREQESGGFSAGRYMPATVEDTYHAVRCLGLVMAIRQAGNRVWDHLMKNPVRVHLDFVTGRLRGEWNNSRRLFQLLCCAYNLAPDFMSYPESVCPVGKIEHFLETRLQRMPVLDECFHAARVRDIMPCSGKISLDILSLMTDYSIKSINELRMLLYLHRHSGCRYLNCAGMTWWASWLRSCRNGDGGYGFFPGTTSYLENVYEAFEAFRLMNMVPEHVDSTAGFVRACRSARGGFGRRCQGIPFPDSTWYGISLLMSLLSMDSVYEQ